MEWQTDGISLTKMSVELSPEEFCINYNGKTLFHIASNYITNETTLQHETSHGIIVLKYDTTI